MVNSAIRLQYFYDIDDNGILLTMKLNEVVDGNFLTNHKRPLVTYNHTK